MNLAGNDNSHFEEKVKIREIALQEIKKQEVRILEMYAGRSLLWQSVKTDKKLRITKIEKERGKNQNALVGDNLKYLPLLENCDFDLIDIDAYGIPIKQILWAVKKRSPVLVTAIRSVFGCAPFALCDFYDIKKDFYDKCKIQISESTFEMIDGVFYRYGYQKKIGYNFGKKQYFLYI